MLSSETAAKRLEALLHREPSIGLHEQVAWLHRWGLSKRGCATTLNLFYELDSEEAARLVHESPAFAYRREQDEMREKIWRAARAQQPWTCDPPLFQEVLERWSWRPISGCPGRYLLIGENDRLPQELALDQYPAHEFQTAKAVDSFVIVALPDGGIISYRKFDGTFLHTLGDADGFRRKFKQLGLRLQYVNWMQSAASFLHSPEEESDEYF